MCAEFIPFIFDNGKIKKWHLVSCEMRQHIKTIISAMIKSFVMWV
jgi:hypothetical protein